MSATTHPLTTEPTESIVHKASADDATTTVLTLTNNEGSKVAYKVKTTDNAMFRIRPVIGLLEPGESAEVSLMCQKMDNPANPPARQRYVVFSILTDKTDGREAWEAAVAETGNKDIGTKKNLSVQWDQEAPPVPQGLPPPPPGLGQNEHVIEGTGQNGALADDEDELIE